MTVNLPAGLFNQGYTDFGKGPGQDAGAPTYKASVLNPQPGTILSLIAQARATGTIVLANFSGSRGNWVDIVGTESRFNQAKYQTQVLRWVAPSKGGTATQAVADAVALAITDRVLLNYVMDEPNHPDFAGSLPNTTVNNIALFHKALWADALTVVRTPASVMEDQPAGGWTGMDYAWAQFVWRPSGLNTPGPWFADQRTRLTAVNVGMLVGHNFLSGGDGRLWDHDNNGATAPQRVFGSNSPTPGLVVGSGATTNTRWLASPQEIKDVADAIYNDANAPCFLWWTHAYDTFTQRDVWLPYELRADFVAAFDYALNKFATRPAFAGFRTPKTLGGGTPPPAPTVGYAYVENTVSQDVTSATFVSVGDASPDGFLNLAVGTGDNDLIAGHTYLILASAQLNIASTTVQMNHRTVHGTSPTVVTNFTGSECCFSNNNTARRQSYFYWTTWVAVAGESIYMQRRCETGQSIAVTVDQACLTAIDIGSLPANSYHENTNTTPTGLTTTFQDGATTTFTPALSADWLVLTEAHITTPSATQRTKSRMTHIAAITLNDPEVWQEGRDAVLDQQLLTTAKVVTVDNVANTFKEQIATTAGTTGSRDVSKIFCLNLNVFAARAWNYTQAVLEYGDDAVDYVTQAQTTQITTTSDAPVFCFTSHNFVPLAQGAAFYSRQQVDQIDGPPTQSSDHYKFYAYDTTDVQPVVHQTVEALNAGTHTLDLDASLFTPGVGRGGRERLALMLQIGSAVGANLPPVWNLINNQTIREGQTLDLTVLAVDPTGEALTYSTVGVLPAGANFDTASRHFIWTPSFFQAGVYTITLRVTDGTTPVDTTFTITVTDVPSILGSTDLRNVRYDAALQSGRFGVVVRWNGQGDPQRRQGLAGIIVEMAEMGRI